MLVVNHCRRTATRTPRKPSPLPLAPSCIAPGEGCASSPAMPPPTAVLRNNPGTTSTRALREQHLYSHIRRSVFVQRCDSLAPTSPLVELHCRICSCSL